MGSYEGSATSPLLSSSPTLSRSPTLPSSPTLSPSPTTGTSYGMEGKFTYSVVNPARWKGLEKTALDVDGKFQYFSADMRPVPPGWYDLDKTKHMVPSGWYNAGSKIPRKRANTVHDFLIDKIKM